MAYYVWPPICLHLQVVCTQSAGLQASDLGWAPFADFMQQWQQAEEQRQQAQMAAVAAAAAVARRQQAAAVQQQQQRPASGLRGSTSASRLGRTAEQPGAAQEQAAAQRQQEETGVSAEEGAAGGNEQQAEGQREQATEGRGAAVRQSPEQQRRPVANDSSRSFRSSYTSQRQQPQGESHAPAGYAAQARQRRSAGVVAQRAAQPTVPQAGSSGAASLPSSPGAEDGLVDGSDAAAAAWEAAGGGAAGAAGSPRPGSPGSFSHQARLQLLQGSDGPLRLLREQFQELYQSAVGEGSTRAASLLDSAAGSPRLSSSSPGRTRDLFSSITAGGSPAWSPGSVRQQERAAARPEPAELTASFGRLGPTQAASQAASLVATSPGLPSRYAGGHASPTRPSVLVAGSTAAALAAGRGQCSPGRGARVDAFDDNVSAHLAMLRLRSAMAEREAERQQWERGFHNSLAVSTQLDEAQAEPAATWGSEGVGQPRGMQRTSGEQPAPAWQPAISAGGAGDVELLYEHLLKQQQQFAAAAEQQRQHQQRQQAYSAASPAVSVGCQGGPACVPQEEVRNLVGKQSTPNAQISLPPSRCACA